MIPNYSAWQKEGRAKAKLKDCVSLRIMEHLERGVNLREKDSLCTLGYSSENAWNIHQEFLEK